MFIFLRHAGTGRIVTGGGGGGAGQYDFSSFPGFFGGSGTIEMVGGAVFKFSLSSVCC